MPERDGPLTILGRKLRSLGPPSLSALIARLGEAEEYERFIEIVREFLPEREQEILHEPTPVAQIAAFCSHFKHRYFPLDDDRLAMEHYLSYGDFTRGIPVIVQGLSYDDYHEISSNFRPGFQLMTYLVPDPMEDDQTRVALAEACAEHVSTARLEQVPEGGFSREECHRLLNDTTFKGLALWADIVCGESGNFFLDNCQEDLWNLELPEWSRETVQHLTQQWQEHEVIFEEVTNMAIWLEEDPPARFEELLKFILERR